MPTYVVGNTAFVAGANYIRFSFYLSHPNLSLGKVSLALHVWLFSLLKFLCWSTPRASVSRNQGQLWASNFTLSIWWHWASSTRIVEDLKESSGYKCPDKFAVLLKWTQSYRSDDDSLGHTLCSVSHRSSLQLFQMQAYPGGEGIKRNPPTSKDSMNEAEPSENSKSLT